MQAGDLNRMFTESASQVLETMFFTCLIGECESEVEDPISASLDFRGKPSGSFGVSLPRPAAHEMAAAFLGLEESEITPGQVNDVVCEMTNMLCGSLLSRLESDHHFELDHPEIVTPPEQSGYSRNFELSSGSLGVWIDLQETQ